jgi:hypothetical protein
MPNPPPNMFLPTNRPIETEKELNARKQCIGPMNRQIRLEKPLLIQFRLVFRRLGAFSSNKPLPNGATFASILWKEKRWCFKLEGMKEAKPPVKLCNKSSGDLFLRAPYYSVGRSNRPAICCLACGADPPQPGAPFWMQPAGASFRLHLLR